MLFRKTSVKTAFHAHSTFEINFAITYEITKPNRFKVCFRPTIERDVLSPIFRWCRNRQTAVVDSHRKWRAKTLLENIRGKKRRRFSSNDTNRLVEVLHPASSSLVNDARQI